MIKNFNFNKSKAVFRDNFFNLLSGFLGLVFTGLIIVFIAGYYQSVQQVNGQNFKAQTSIKLDNSSFVGGAFKIASSTIDD